MTGVRLLPAVSLLLVASVGAGQQAAPERSAIARGVAVVPDTVRVGDPFRLVVRVRAPAGSIIEFPTAPDSGTGVEALDPVQVLASPDTSAVEQSATYRMAAWDVGHLRIRLRDVLVHEGDSVRHVPLPLDLGVQVVSVLPADSAQRVPKPPRALFEFGPPWWWWALVALVTAAIIGLLWWWWRRRERPSVERATPYQIAQLEFERIRALDLVASGETGHYVALTADVLRAYLAAEVSAAQLSLTANELIQVLRGEGRVPFIRLVRLLHEVDLVKFAGAPVPAERASSLGDESRDLVEQVERAAHPSLRQEAA